MALVLKYNKSLYITILYLTYMLNYSVLTVLLPEFYFQILRNGSLILLFFIFLRFLKFKLNYGMFIFLLVCFLSIFFNNTHPVFKVEVRFIFLLILFTSIGLVLKTKYSSEVLINFKQIFKINTVVVILSFISYFSVIGSLGRGNFSGILNHSNSLGPIAALVCLDRVVQYFNGRKSLMSVVIGLIAFFVLILSGSRAALGTLLISFFVIGIYVYRLKFIIWGSGILVLLTIAFFTLKEYNHLLVPEGHLSNRYRPRTMFEKGFDNTRFIIWQERFDEFAAKPILGSGFAAVNTEVIPEESGSYSLNTGSIQPGSGYLGLLSMLGTLGILSFFMLLFLAIRKMYKNRRYYEEKDFLIITSILMFVLIHSIFEGYLISSGNFLFFIFWLSISYIFNKHEQYN